jgi:hypothetical protein
VEVSVNISVSSSERKPRYERVCRNAGIAPLILTSTLDKRLDGPVSNLFPIPAHSLASIPTELWRPTSNARGIVLVIIFIGR